MNEVAQLEGCIRLLLHLICLTHLRVSQGLESFRRKLVGGGLAIPAVGVGSLVGGVFGLAL